MDSSKLPSGITPEQIEQWKHELKIENVKLVTVTDKIDPDKVYKAVFRPLTKRTIGLCLRFIEKDIYKACDIAVKNEWLGGDTIIKEKAEYVVNAGGKLMEGLDQAEAELEDL